MAQEYITVNKAKDLLPFGVLLVSLAMAWGTLNSQLSLTAHKVETIDRKLDKVETAQNVMGNDISRIKQALNDLSGRNIISRANTQPVSTRSASIQPTPFPQSLAFNNLIEVKPEEKQQENKEVLKPAPSPTPEPTPLISLPIIGDIFFLDL